MTSTYSAGMMSQSFWFLEFKKIVKLSVKGLTADRIRVASVEDNLFGAVNENRTKRMAGYLINRVATMQEREKELFLDADVDMQKQMNLVTMLRLDRLFFEFLYEVYREKHIFGTEELTDGDIHLFMNQKEAQSEEIAGWKDTTRRKLTTCYTTFMTEAGLLRIEGKGKERVRKITPPLMNVSLENYLIAIGEEAVVKAVTGQA